jgi:DNA-binding phage protein
MDEDETGSGSRWRQLRTRVLATPEGQQRYAEGYQRAVSYQQTMALIDVLRRKLGISQSELARRMERAQPTVARLLRRGQNPTLASLEEVLRALGVHGRLIIEPGEADGSALTVEVREVRETTGPQQVTTPAAP